MTENHKVLGKKQKRILKILKELNSMVKFETVLEKLGEKENSDLLMDIKILEENKYVRVIWTTASAYPGHIGITPSGYEKADETFIRRLKDSANSNPWVAISVVIALIFGIAGILWYLQLNALETEKAELLKPKLIAPETRVEAGKINEISFTVFNPSDNDYFYLGGSCQPEDPGLFLMPQPSNTSFGTPSGEVGIPKKKNNRY